MSWPGGRTKATTEILRVAQNDGWGMTMGVGNDGVGGEDVRVNSDLRG
jgi:hypothetical protein